VLLLLGALDTFADDAHPQVVGELDEAAHDRVAGFVAAEVGDE
jgi:hypothetical protein